MTNWSILAQAGKRTKARKRRILGPIRAIAEREQQAGLEGVDFASSRAEILAREAGLSWRDFANARCTGCAGFTAGDVRTVIAGKVPPEAEPEDEFMEEETDEAGAEEAEE